MNFKYNSFLVKCIAKQNLLNCWSFKRNKLLVLFILLLKITNSFKIAAANNLMRLNSKLTYFLNRPKQEKTQV
jgi:hypothetical protein